MNNIDEVISSYNWFAPFCQCIHSDGVFKGMKKLCCNSPECDLGLSNKKLEEETDSE